MSEPIGEAFTALRESVLVHINGPEDDKPPCEACDNAARALAVASAKAMLPPRSQPGAKTGIERRYLALKAQIEGLGR